MMRYSAWLLLIGFGAMALNGCSGDYNVAPIPTATDSGGASAPPAQANAPAAEAGSPPAATPAKPAPAVAPPPVAAGPPIRLSAGVALPQSLPTGTAMGFSVDYRFVQGGPQTASQYVWVIQSNQPNPVRQDVQLQQEGTLQMFVPPWRPENGPFQCHIEDGNGQTLSNSMPLR